MEKGNRQLYPSYTRNLFSVSIPLPRENPSKPELSLNCISSLSAPWTLAPSPIIHLDLLLSPWSRRAINRSVAVVFLSRCRCRRGCSGEDEASGLLQDYQDLIKETEATKKRILKAKQKKLKLLAEVKFLKRKLQSFAGGHSLEIPLKLKKESYRVAIPSPELEQMHNSGLPRKAHMDDRSHDITEAATRGTSALSDSNQVSNRPASQFMRYTQILDSGLPSNDFSVDRNYRVTEAAARGITAPFDLNQVSNKQVPPSMSNAHMHNSGLPPKAPLVDRKHKVTQAETLKTTTLSDSNQVSYRPVPPSSRYSHMHKSGLPPKAPRNHKITEAATRENTALFDLNEVSYRAAPQCARYSQMNSSGLPSKAFTVVGNYEVTEAAKRGTSTL